MPKITLLANRNGVVEIVEIVSRHRDRKLHKVLSIGGARVRILKPEDEGSVWCEVRDVDAAQAWIVQQRKRAGLKVPKFLQDERDRRAKS